MGAEGAVTENAVNIVYSAGYSSTVATYGTGSRNQLLRDTVMGLYTFKMKGVREGGEPDVKMKIETVSLKEILPAFEDFLKGMWI